MNKKIVASLALALVIVGAATAAPQSACCDASKCKTTCKVACYDAPCCDAAKGKAAPQAKGGKALRLVKKAAKSGSCCAMPCCNGGACCAVGRG